MGERSTTCMSTMVAALASPFAWVRAWCARTLPTRRVPQVGQLHVALQLAAIVLNSHHAVWHKFLA